MMKRIGFYVALMLAGFVFNQELIAGGYELEGNWRCNTSGTEIEIYPTDFGFKSKHRGQNSWSYFDEVYQDHYRDSDGNEYHWRGDNGLFYTSSYGNQQMTFHRVREKGRRDRNWNGSNKHNSSACTHDQYHCSVCNNGGQEYGDYRGDRLKNYDNRNGRYGYDELEPRGYNYRHQRLNGLWFSNRGRGAMRIKVDHKSMKIKFDRDSRWIHFKQKRNGVFKDRHGNKIRVISGNRIQWTSDCGRYTKIFQKSRTRGYRNR